MTATNDLEHRLAGLYAAEAPARAPDWLLEEALSAIDITPQRRAVIGVRWRLPRMSTAARLAVAATLLIAAAAIGLALAGNRAPVPLPLTWTQDSLLADWPAPARNEPGSRAPTLHLVRGDDSYWEGGVWEELEYVDPVGDGGPNVPWVDIAEVRLSPGHGDEIRLELAGSIPQPVPNPADRWIAYGIVIDTDGDGGPDMRVGIDNMPGGPHRAWATDLASGRTLSKAGPWYSYVGVEGGPVASVGLITSYPGESSLPGFSDEEADFSRALLRWGGASGPVYAWASMIEDGRVIATDYAPDVGWLIQPEDPGLPLEGPGWVTEREIQGGELIIGATLRFAGDGQLLFDAGCRTGTADVVVGPDSMQVSNLSVVGDGCRTEEGREFEAEILSMLSAGTIAYTNDRGVLELRAGPAVLQLQGTLEGPG